MRAVLLRKIHINKITPGGSQAPSIPAHEAVPGNVPGRGNLMVCNVMEGDGPGSSWPQTSHWPSISGMWPTCSGEWGSAVLAGALLCQGSHSLSRHREIPAGCAALELQLLYIQMFLWVPCTALGQQKQLHGTWFPKVSSPLTVDTVSIASRNSAL